MRLRNRSRGTQRGCVLSLGEKSMKLVEIYECFCDPTRLRILHLLRQTPLCVCHFQDVLREPQVKISKHLAYLRQRGLVTTRRDRNWIIYSLPRKRSQELETNLQCLQDCVSSDPIFRKDSQRLEELQSSCCEPAGVLAK
ncbi:metalloregulator ArsR/SmtB family transcription factor [soil metagenome]